MIPHLRVFAAIVALSLAGFVGYARAQPLRPQDGEEALLRDAARLQVGEALQLFDARRLLRLPSGGFERPASNSEGDRARARELLQSAAYVGDTTARDLLARMLQAGVGGPADEAQARKLYEEAGTRGARWRLAGMLERGEGGPQDLLSARRVYKLASDMGQLDARYDWARMARSGFGGTPDLAGAREALSTMDVVCHGDAAGLLADMAERGEGGPRDHDLAARQYLRQLDCAGRFYAKPAVTVRWPSLAVETRLRINAILRGLGMQDAPRNDRVPTHGWETRYLSIRRS
jgi:TPR repeat protein